MVQVLEPFKVGAGHTTAVCQHVGDGDNTTLKQGLFGEISGWAISAFDDNLALQVIDVVSVDSLLLGSGNEDVTFKLHKFRWVDLSFGGCSIETFESAPLHHVVLNIIDLKAIRVIDSRIVFNDADNLGTILLKELGGPVADSTKALDDDGLASNAFG